MCADFCLARYTACTSSVGLIDMYVTALVVSADLIRAFTSERTAAGESRRGEARCERFERASFERESFERTIFSACHFSDMTFERLSNTAIFNWSESRVSAKPISATTI